MIERKHINFFSGNKRAQLLGRPLARLLDLDDLSSIPPPTFESDDKVRSRFVNTDTTDSMLQNIKDSKDFDTRKDDPIFLVSYSLGHDLST